MSTVLISQWERSRDCGHCRNGLQVAKGRFRIGECDTSCDNGSFRLGCVGKGACDGRLGCMIRSSRPR